MTPLTLVTPDAHVAPAAPVAAGLASAEAQRRLTEFGPNEIRREQATSALRLLVRQFASPVIWLLLVATVLSAALGEWLDAIAIGAIVILNAVIGFFQEHRAERAVMALRAMTAPRARVQRDGQMAVVANGVNQCRRARHLAQKPRRGLARCGVADVGRRTRSDRDAAAQGLGEAEVLSPRSIERLGIAPVGLVDFGDVRVVVDASNGVAGHEVGI